MSLKPDSACVPEERVGAAFDPALFAESRRLSHELVREVASVVRPGMSEDDAHAAAGRVFKGRRIEKFWHATKIRFGRNTTCNFGDPSDPGVRLATGDLFFVDLGIVWKGHEGDAGDTFVVGEAGPTQNDPIIEASHAVFAETRNAWMRHGWSGERLYAHAAAAAKSRGFELNPRMDGHRLSDFPHAVHFKGGLAEFGTKPAASLWVLEIHLLDRSRGVGAFFEDLLV